MKTINWKNAVTAVSAITLIAICALVLGGATAWAATGILGFGLVLSIIVYLLCVVPALVATYLFGRQVLQIEPIFEGAAPRLPGVEGNAAT